MPGTIPKEVMMSKGGVESPSGRLVYFFSLPSVILIVALLHLWQPDINTFSAYNQARFFKPLVWWNNLTEFMKSSWRGCSRT